MTHVNAAGIADEIAASSDPTPCADLEPSPYVPGRPHACSRPNGHTGLHVATVPADEQWALYDLIAAVWGAP